MIFRRLSASIILIFICFTAIADVIHLKSGRTIKGTILEETSDKVLIEMTMGSVSYPKSKIERIERDSQGNERRKMVSESAKYEVGIDALNRSVSSLFAQKGQVSSLKGKVIRQEKQIADLDEKAIKLNSKLGVAMEEWEPLRIWEGRQAPDRIVAQYNAARANVETLQREIAELQTQQHAIRIELGETRQVLSKNNQILNQQLNKVRETRRVLITEGCPIQALASIDRKLTGFGGATTVSNKVKLRRRGDGLFVMVRLNENVIEEFMIDTGCTGILLTPSLARRLNLKPEAYIGKSVAEIADGSLMEIQNVALDSVEVSGHRANKVFASIGPESGSLLLGMSYFGRFNFSIDPSRAILTLE